MLSCHITVGPQTYCTPTHLKNAKQTTNHLKNETQNYNTYRVFKVRFCVVSVIKKWLKFYLVHSRSILHANSISVLLTFGNVNFIQSFNTMHAKILARNEENDLPDL